MIGKFIAGKKTTTTDWAKKLGVLLLLLLLVKLVFSHRVHTLSSLFSSQQSRGDALWQHFCWATHNNKNNNNVLHKTRAYTQLMFIYSYINCVPIYKTHSLLNKLCCRFNLCGWVGNDETMKHILCSLHSHSSRQCILIYLNPSITICRSRTAGGKEERWTLLSLEGKGCCQVARESAFRVAQTTPAFVPETTHGDSVTGVDSIRARNSVEMAGWGWWPCNKTRQEDGLA